MGPPLSFSPAVSRPPLQHINPSIYYYYYHHHHHHHSLQRLRYCRCSVSASSDRQGGAPPATASPPPTGTPLQDASCSLVSCSTVVEPTPCQPAHQSGYGRPLSGPLSAVCSSLSAALAARCNPFLAARCPLPIRPRQPPRHTHTHTTLPRYFRNGRQFTSTALLAPSNPHLFLTILFFFFLLALSILTIFRLQAKRRSSTQRRSLRP